MKDSSSSNDPSYFSFLGSRSPRFDPRRQAEMAVVRSFTSTVLEHGRSIMQQRKSELQHTQGAPGSTGLLSGRHSTAIDFTEEERPVFHKQSYYGWTQGILAGGGTFVVLFGGLRWLAARRKRFHLPPKPHQSLAELDGSRRTSSVSTIPAQQSSDSMALSDDVMAQLQFMCIGAFSVVLTTVVANLYADQPRFFRELSQVPLQPGKSVLCHQMCPDLIAQLERLRQRSMLDAEFMRRHGRPGPPSLVAGAEQYTVEELLDDPATEELESILHLVQNCEQRLAYQKELRGSAAAADEEEIVEVPPPGVAANYLGVDVRRSPEVDW